MRNREGGANSSTDQQTLTVMGQSPDQHASAGAHADFGQVLSIHTVTLELSFCIHIGSVAQTGVYHGRVKHVAFTVGQYYCFGKNSDSGFARDAAWFVDLGHPPLHGGADRNYGLSGEHDSVHHSPGEGIAFLAGES